jgi:hypothetical protein
MLRKKDITTPCKCCGEEFTKKRTEQEFCSAHAGMRRGKNPENDASRVPHGEALLMPFFANKNSCLQTTPYP